MTLEEMNEKVSSYEAKITELEASVKKANDDKDKDNTAEEKKEQEDAAIRKAEDMEKEKTAKRVAAIRKAMEHNDPKDREAALKQAMEEDDHKNDKTAEMEEKIKKQEAEMEEYKKEAALPHLTMLASLYERTGIDESKLTEYKASWDKMSIIELKAEIEKVKPFVENYQESAASTVPVAPTAVAEFDASKDDTLRKLSKSSDVDIMNGGIR